MKLSEALNEKNRLARSVKEIQGRIRAHNSFIKGNARVYDTRKLLAKLDETTNDLVAIKSKISEANQSIQTKIFRLSELKSISSFLKKLEIKEGKIQDQRWNAEVCDWEADLGIVERDGLVEQYEKEIGLLQSQLEDFNYTAKI